MAMDTNLLLRKMDRKNDLVNEMVNQSNFHLKTAKTIYNDVNSSDISTKEDVNKMAFKVYGSEHYFFEENDDVKFKESKGFFSMLLYFGERILKVITFAIIFIFMGILCLALKSPIFLCISIIISVLVILSVVKHKDSFY